MKKDYLTHNGDHKQYAKLYAEYEKQLAAWKEKYKKELAENDEGDRFPTMNALMLGDMPFPPSRVEITPDGYKLHVYGLYNTYPIEKITTKAPLRAWLRCLSGKRWFDGRLCEDFINAVADTNKWELPFIYD